MKTFIEKMRIFESQLTSDMSHHGEAGILSESRKKKPDCRSGNKWFDKNGRFSTKEKATSWSGGYEDSNRTDCLAGKFKTSGDGKKKITRHLCGRRKDGGKHPYKCKSGEKAYQEHVEETETALIASKRDAVEASSRNTSEDTSPAPKSRKSKNRAIRVYVMRKPVVEALVSKSKFKKQSVILEDIIDGILELIETTQDEDLKNYIFQELERLPNRDMSSEELRSICSKSGYVSPEKYLDFINKSALASDGKLNEPQKAKA